MIARALCLTKSTTHILANNQIEAIGNDDTKLGKENCLCRSHSRRSADRLALGNGARRSKSVADVSF
ncbi:MAG: hypothetical protein ACK53Y_16895 [bacterium]